MWFIGSTSENISVIPGLLWYMLASSTSRHTALSNRVDTSVWCCFEVVSDDEWTRGAELSHANFSMSYKSKCLSVCDVTPHTAQRRPKSPENKIMKSFSWPFQASRLQQQHSAGRTPRLGCRYQEVPRTRSRGKARETEWTKRAAHFLPLDMSLADSCRTSSGILSHWLSERHRSISVSSREPDFRAVIFVSGARLDQNTHISEDPSRRGERQAAAYETHGVREQSFKIKGLTTYGCALDDKYKNHVKKVRILCVRWVSVNWLRKLLYPSKNEKRATVLLIQRSSFSG